MTKPRRKDGDVLKNNPLRIRRNEILKLGLAPEQTDPEYFRFRDPGWAYRAAFVMLRVYRHRFRICTIRGLAENWRSHRDACEREIYIRQLAVLSGLGPEEPVDERRPDKLMELVQAIGRVESSPEPVCRRDVRLGWLRYLG